MTTGAVHQVGPSANFVQAHSASTAFLGQHIGPDKAAILNTAVLAGLMDLTQGHNMMATGHVEGVSANMEAALSSLGAASAKFPVTDVAEIGSEMSTKASSPERSV